MIEPPNKIPIGKTSSLQPQFRKSKLLIPSNPQRIGDKVEIALSELGSTSTGTQTPPIAERMTTEIAATGNAWLVVLNIEPINKP